MHTTLNTCAIESGVHGQLKQATRGSIFCEDRSTAHASAGGERLRLTATRAMRSETELIDETRVIDETRATSAISTVLSSHNPRGGRRLPEASYRGSSSAKDVYLALGRFGGIRV